MLATGREAARWGPLPSRIPQCETELVRLSCPLSASGIAVLLQAALLHGRLPGASYVTLEEKPFPITSSANLRILGLLEAGSERGIKY
ncbi:hypothetical protein AV530_006721 [Patagioenas fasciata monilis]|uniref:Uncharacterized protein n=1 Tax=Patagioenas fasciata monilis TaxID=372326 RepID=A0A1V4KQ88_PATFA|nr:hypothetical protein AV530_006721 [Patagioenas fasciata monilis]